MIINGEIRFTYEANTVSVNFLDLVITEEEGKLITKTFFKATDRNGYIPVGSCHHPRWLEAIPKGQFQRLRRNCSKIEDFKEQADILKNSFLDKGYKSDTLESDLTKITNMEREMLLKPTAKNRKNNNFERVFVTTFSSQHWWVNKVYEKALESSQRG